MSNDMDWTRLRAELGSYRLEMREQFHGLNLRLSKLEWQDTQFADSGVEWRKQLQDRFAAVEARVAVFEEHKKRFAWLGWSLLIAGALGVLRLWWPASKAFF
jgi:hypothetical protein